MGGAQRPRPVSLPAVAFQPPVPPPSPCSIATGTAAKVWADATAPQLPAMQETGSPRVGLTFASGSGIQDLPAASRQRHPTRRVPPPPVPDLGDRPRLIPSPGSRMPNVALARAMTGRCADWERIRRMATQLSDPEYSLIAFFEDCVASFPELSLFFDGVDAGVARRGGRKADSGIAGEDEYQRTVGALFTVYWLFRLDGDGPTSFCCGVDDRWEPLEPGTGSSSGSSGSPAPQFSKLTAEEKRASFLSTFDWQQFGDLVSRAGCDKAAPGSLQRTVALLCLTAFHDIMKLPYLQPVVLPEHAPYHGFEAGVRIHDHDLALSYVLEHFPELLPSYAGLDLQQRTGVLFTQAKMQFNHGWFVQAEAPPGAMLCKFKRVLESGAAGQDIDLYFLHWVTDLAGAEATPLGGAEKLVLQFPRAVLASFLWSMPYLRRLKGCSETELVEQYLEARWAALMPKEAIPSDRTAVALMRLAVMAQCEDASSVVEAFRSLGAADQKCLTTELSRTACQGQLFRRHAVMGGPAFLVYYGPALLQRSNGSQKELRTALQTLCTILRGSRALWPMSLEAEGSSVTIMIGEIKSQPLEEAIGNPGGSFRSVWILRAHNNQEGQVTLCRACDLNALYMENARFRILDLTPEAEEEDEEMVHALSLSIGRRGWLTAKPSDDGSGVIRVFTGGKRLLVFTDMSTECDDEAALLWLLAALNRRPNPTTVELVQTDSHVRFIWMAHIFADRFALGGEWELDASGTSFQAGNVVVNLYLAHAPSREQQIIDDIKKKAPYMGLDFEAQVDGQKDAASLRKIRGLDYRKVPGGHLDSIIVAAAIPDVDPSFFTRFTTCKCTYVVGTPGGINCPMPSWVDLLAAMHGLAPVVYLTPQLTRMVRFPCNYVATNADWSETIKRTVWDATLTCMARRPELPPGFGSWGLVLRLNVANAMLCRDWYSDVMGTSIDSAQRPPHVIRWVQAYVDRNSGDDRELGTIVEELAAIHVEDAPGTQATTEPPARRCTPCTGRSLLSAVGCISKGHKKSTMVALRQKYREALFEQAMICVLTSEALLLQSSRNLRVGVDDAGFETLRPRCGYLDPLKSLSDLFGADDAIALLRSLPLRRLTPAYDVVGMIFADLSLEPGTDLDGGLGLLLAEASPSYGSALLSAAQLRLSDHPLLMTVPQTGDGIYAAGPFN